MSDDIEQTKRAPAAIRAALTAVDKILTQLERLAIGVVIGVILVVVVLIAADALGRYLFNKPLFFTIYLVSHYLLTVVMLLPAAMVLRSGRHISVDMFASLLPERLFQALIGIALVATVPVVWVMAFRVSVSTVESFHAGKVAYGVIPWPLWAEQAIFAVCLLMLTARLLHVAAANITAALTGDRSVAVDMINHHESPLEEAI